MIKIYKPSCAILMLHPDAIASIEEAGPSSQWHGIKAFVRTFDGRVIESGSTVREIESAIQRKAASNYLADKKMRDAIEFLLATSGPATAQQEECWPLLIAAITEKWSQ